MAERHGVDVPVSTLESLVEAHQIGKFILVLDIEGAEAQLFLQAEKAIENCFRIIGALDGGVAEGRWYSGEELVARLASTGFRCIYRHGNRMAFQNERNFGPIALS